MVARRPFAAAVLVLLVAGNARAEAACDAPAAVCAARGAVYAISSFDPLASAVLVAPDLLVTNRHVVADQTRVVVHGKDGAALAGTVVPTSFAGDLVLVSAPGLGGIAATFDEARAGALYAVGADRPDGTIRVYAPGVVAAAPAAGKPLARLHHSAYSQPGNSGGGLFDEHGRLVAIVTGGGEGRNDAIPVARLAQLRAMSGPEHAAASAALGRAYRDCIEGLEHAVVDALEAACRASGNRQLIDDAGRAFGEAGRYDTSAALFRAALTIDPNSLNSAIGLAVTLHRDDLWHEEAAILRDVVAAVPGDFAILRMAVQAGKFAEDAVLIERALAGIEAHFPDALDAAREFVEN